MQHRLLLAAALVLAGCRTSDDVATGPAASDPYGAAAALRSSGHHHGPYHQREGELPVEQLQQAKRASARYNDVENAKADGYKDINVVIQNMGRHFLKDSLLDGTFDVEHPELLVYSPDEAGILRLVAVEYAIPRDLSKEEPEGFEGKVDDWTEEVDFPLWTLHAWVWKQNPDGVFSPTNSRVP